MNAAATISLAPALVVDPVDYLLVDLATGRHLPGDAVHVEQLAEEHGLTCTEAREAVEAAWQLGFVLLGPGGTSGIVSWTPESTQRQLHRLARAMVAAVAGVGAGRQAPRHVIDGEQSRLGAVQLFGLTTPDDVDVFLELGRALLGSTAPALVDEVTVPLAVLLSEAAQVVHGMEFAAPAAVRREMVATMVSSLIDGRIDDFRDAIADYVVALSID
ncbi:hypothetical protein [Frondihabitans australicus]|uniref:Uncharacterized protein n=1 Tax=Frondihabitans australicus TaxID=386892 RepID=A0A495II78_9MICO|nr:hypothetical protein [Frondihabitans australicus]RKR75742.1 hypothetical protein C8E83_2896 [Frondihabitans australicus]